MKECPLHEGVKNNITALWERVNNCVDWKVFILGISLCLSLLYIVYREVHDVSAYAAEERKAIREELLSEKDFYRALDELMKKVDK